MLALLRKDAPWMVVFAVAGLLVALGTVLFADPIDLLLFDHATAEATFWTALAGGLGLGLLAGVFDELLGARELLRQRPVSARRVMAARFVAVGMVLLTWHLALPLVLLLWWPFAAVEGLSWSVGNWLEPQASLAVAWPMAAVMLFCASLPLGRLARLVAAGAMFYVVMLVIDGVIKQAGQHDPAAYFTCCLLVAGGLATLAVLGAGSGADADADRPVATSMPKLLRWGLVIGFALAVAAGAIEWEAQAIQRLHRIYPEPWLHGRDVVLVTARAPAWTTVVVDAEHADTEQQLTGGKGTDWAQRWPYLTRDNEFAQPRWRSRTRSIGRAWWQAGELHLVANGTLWWEQWSASGGRRFELLTTAAVPRFSFAARLVGSNHVFAVFEPGADRIWRLDIPSRRLVAHPLPGGDRVRGGRQSVLRHEGFTDAELQQWRKLATVDAQEGQEVDSLVVVFGERGCYTLIGGVLQEFPGRDGDASAASVYEDPIVFTRSMPATAAHAAFVHSYEPRTADEHRAVLAAMAISSLRPPLLQGIAHLAPASARPGWLFDGLVVDGRRPWLVLVQLLIGVPLAWIARRSLGRHGVPSGLWVVQILLFGFAAFLLFVALERPRRLLRRPVPAPPSLRIGTLPASSV